MFVKPFFYDNFVCKASDCTDTCCAGWEIDIDDIALCKYRSVKGDYSQKILSGIDMNDDGTHVFRLKEKDKCFFLCDNGLCDIYSELGKDYLCDICREHPRFYNFYLETTEAGLGLCCEKACELLFCSDAEFYLISEGDFIDEDYEDMFHIRNKCFETVNVRDDFSVSLIRLIEYVAEENSYYSGCSFSLRNEITKANLFGMTLDLFSATEPINCDWSELVSSLNENLNEICRISDAFHFDASDYRKFVCYTLYRHFIESAYNGNMLSGLSFSLISLIFIHMCDCYTVIKKQRLELKDRIDNVKLWSKQIEYSDLNTEMLLNNAAELLFVE